MIIDFGREVCGRIGVASNREWLVTNGIGGYAMGTVAGMLTRRYHGLLVAALNPPLGRTLMMTKLGETVYYNGQYYDLHTDRWYGDVDDDDDDDDVPTTPSMGVDDPLGLYNIERFRLEGTVPHWTFACADAVLEKRIWMKQGENTTYIQYTLVRASQPFTLYPKAMVNYRDYHKTMIAADLDTFVEGVDNGLRVFVSPHAHPLHLLSDKATVYQQEEWHEDYFLTREEYRGQPDVVEDHLHIADFEVTLQPGESVTFVASTQPRPSLDGDAEYALQKAHEQGLIARVENINGEIDDQMKQLVVAAGQFVVERPLPNDETGHSVIAGYPWFGDWGRDTMISIPGLTMCSGRPEIALSILRTYAQYVDQGMLPNRFPDEGETPEYNTADASLWYFQAIRTYIEGTQDDEFLREIYPVLQNIIHWHEKGTRYNIKMDRQDGLLYAGEAGVQLTWMDAKLGSWVVTPRTGKAVEINALWYNALCCMGVFAKRLGYNSIEYDNLASKTKVGFARFWNVEAGYCYDVLDTPIGTHNSQLRPNQLLAVSLSHSPLEAEQQKTVLDICTAKLLTSHGLRTLDIDDPEFIGHYGGDMKKRDASYHQGTVWGWLIGPFIAANLRVYKDPELARSYLKPALRHLRDHGLGSISEIFDGDAPFTPRGCPAQAWSVAEFLRAWCMIRKMETSTNKRGKG